MPRPGAWRQFAGQAAHGDGSNKTVGVVAGRRRLSRPRRIRRGPDAICSQGTPVVCVLPTGHRASWLTPFLTRPPPASTAGKCAYHGPASCRAWPKSTVDKRVLSQASGATCLCATSSYACPPRRGLSLAAQSQARPACVSVARHWAGRGVGLAAQAGMHLVRGVRRLRTRCRCSSEESSANHSRALHNKPPGQRATLKHAPSPLCTACPRAASRRASPQPWPLAAAAGAATAAGPLALLVQPRRHPIVGRQWLAANGRWVQQLRDRTECGSTVAPLQAAKHNARQMIAERAWGHRVLMKHGFRVAIVSARSAVPGHECPRFPSPRLGCGCPIITSTRQRGEGEV